MVSNCGFQDVDQKSSFQDVCARVLMLFVQYLAHNTLSIHFQVSYIYPFEIVKIIGLCECVHFFLLAAVL